MNRLTVRISVLQGLTLLFVALPFIATGAYVGQKHMWAQARLSELEPRHARLQGIQAMRGELESAAQKAQTLVEKQAYAVAVDATKAGNDAQQRIRAIFTESQINVESLQVLEAKDAEQVQTISVVLRVEGTLPNMQKAFLRLRTQAPVILLESFSLQSTGAVKPVSEQRLQGSFGFTVLRLRS